MKQATTQWCAIAWCRTCGWHTEPAQTLAQVDPATNTHQRKNPSHSTSTSWHLTQNCYLTHGEGNEPWAASTTSAGA